MMVRTGETSRMLWRSIYSRNSAFNALTQVCQGRLPKLLDSARKSRIVHSVHFHGCCSEGINKAHSLKNKVEQAVTVQRVFVVNRSAIG